MELLIMDAHIVALPRQLFAQFKHHFFCCFNCIKSNRGLICISCYSITKCQVNILFSKENNQYNICVRRALAK